MSEKEGNTAVKANTEGNGGTISPIPQVDGFFDAKAEYEVMIDAHETCTSDDIIEQTLLGHWMK